MIITKNIQLSHLTNLITQIKGYIDNKIITLSSSVADLFDEVDTALDNQSIYARVEVPTTGWEESTTHSGYMENVITVTSSALENPIWAIIGATDSVFPTDSEQEAFNQVNYMISSSTSLTFYTKETNAPLTFYTQVQGVTI